jgi:amidohydrolase
MTPARPLAALLALLALIAAPAAAPASPPAAAAALAPLDALAPELDALYLDLHRHPELSFQEEKTSATVAARLRALGFEVTERVGGFGVVGVLENGTGPTVLVRTDMDALPVEEKTGLPYASTVTARDDAGRTVPVMHACGHDVHMSAFVGAATLLSRARASWKGKLVFIGQPAEERGAGAAAMLKDGLYARFGKPDFAIAVHDTNDVAAGSVGWTAGPALASVDSVDVVFHGKGGHGAYPHTTVDPVVMGARFVVAVQTLVSRENSPFDPAVVTVGSFQAGTKHNIIPDTAHLQLTVRSYKETVRRRLLDGIARIARAEAAAAAAPREPEVTFSEPTPATTNDPALTRRWVAAIAAALGADHVQERPPVMGGEDFSHFGLSGVPAAMVWVGAATPAALAEARAAGRPMPSLHSALFAPDRGPAVRTGAAALTLGVLELLGTR